MENFLFLQSCLPMALTKWYTYREDLQIEDIECGNQITLDSLDVHVGQSYSVLVTADQTTADYFMVATPKMYRNASDQLGGLVGIGVLHYDNSWRASFKWA
jgi:hypothetical protein